MPRRSHSFEWARATLGIVFILRSPDVSIYGAADQQCIGDLHPNSDDEKLMTVQYFRCVLWSCCSRCADAFVFKMCSHEYVKLCVGGLLCYRASIIQHVS